MVKSAMFSHSYEDLQHTVCYKLYDSWNITSKEKYTYSKGVKSSMPSQLHDLLVDAPLRRPFSGRSSPSPQTSDRRA